MVILFYAVLAFVVAQCVFWSMQGLSYAGLAVTVVSVIGAGKIGVAFGLQLQVTTGQGVVYPRTRLLGVLVDCQAVGIHRLPEQCLVNDAPIWNASTQTSPSVCDYLESWAQRGARDPAYVRPHSKSSVRCIMCPLRESISSMSHKSSPPHTCAYPSGRFARFDPYLLLCAFVGLFGLVFLVVRLPSKITFSRWVENPTWVLLYWILVGEGIQIRRPQVPTTWKGPPRQPLNPETLTQVFGAKRLAPSVTVTTRSAVTPETSKPIFTTTLVHQEASTTIEETSKTDVSRRTGGDNDEDYLSEDLFGARDSCKSALVSSEGVDSFVEDSSSSDQLPTFVANSASTVPSEGGTNTQANSGFPTNTSPQLQQETMADTVATAPASISADGVTALSEGIVDISVQTESDGGSDAEAATEQEGENEETVPQPVNSEGQIPNTGSNEPGSPSTNVQNLNAQTGSLHSTAAAPAPITATSASEDLDLPDTAAPTTALAGPEVIERLTDRFASMSLEYLSSPVEENEELADGPGEQDTEGETDDEMATEAPTSTAQSEIVFDSNGVLDAQPSTVGVAMEVTPTQPGPELSVVASSTTVIDPAVITVIQLPFLRKRKTLAVSTFWGVPVERINDPSARPNKRQRTILAETPMPVAAPTQPSQSDTPPTEPRAPTAEAETPPAQQLEWKPDGKRKAVSKKASGSSRKNKSAGAYREGYQAAMMEMGLREKMKARKGTQKEEGWTGKSNKKGKINSKGKGKEREQDEKQARKASLKEDENAAGPSTRILPDTVTTTTAAQDPISNGSPADDGESAHVASDTASLSTPDQPPLGPAGSATLPAQPENETHDQDYTEESSLNTQPDVPRTDASVHEEQDESVAPPRDTHPPAKVKKVILRVREPEPELEIQGATRSRMSRVARSHQQPYQVARQKRAEGEKALADVRTRGENVTGTENMAPEGGSSSSTGTQCAPVAAQDPTQWLGDFWAELKGMLAATPSDKDKNEVTGLSTRAGVEDVPETEQAIGSEDPRGTDAAAKDMAHVGTPSAQPSSPQTRQVVVHDALKDLKSMLDGFKQSLAAAESSAQPDVSVLANSSGETGSSELSQIFTTTDLSVDTQESKLPDYEDAMAERADARPSQPDVQVKQEEEEYVFPPWDGGAASGSHLNEDTGEEDPQTGSEEQTSVGGAPRTVLPTSDAARTNGAKRQREDDEDDDEFLPLKRMRALVLTSNEG